jgi:pimeloyl-ACP methyl ester carboxylesterase
MLDVDASTESHDAMSALVARFDPEVIHLPRGSARIRLEAGDETWDVLASADGAELVRGELRIGADSILTADEETWMRLVTDVRGGMDAFRQGRLQVRRNLHLGVGFLAATSGITEAGRLRFDAVRTKKSTLSILSAGTGEPVLCVHGLGGTKASFLPTVAALAESHRVIAVDLPGFGESDKPIAAAYDAPYFARAVTGLMDALEIDSAHIVGNSLGGRVAIEVGLSARERVRNLVLLSPALAWLRDRPLKLLLQLPLPRLGLIQPTPRWAAEPIVRRLIPGGDQGWVAAGVDEFLRCYLTPRGRTAFYEAARNIYLDEPNGNDGFWTRLGGLECETMFVWGRKDTLVPLGFMKHVERTLPRARHVELDCGHVPQLERPRETHAAILSFLGESGS